MLFGEEERNIYELLTTVNYIFVLLDVPMSSEKCLCLLTRGSCSIVKCWNAGQQVKQ